MRPKASEFDHEMNRLEAEIKRLEAEYNMFFAGRLPRLPWETRARVEKLVKHYDRMNLSNTAQRFRFGAVQARFMSFCELWERSLRAREEGGRQAPGRPSSSVVPAASGTDTETSVPADTPSPVKPAGEPAPLAASEPKRVPPPDATPLAPAAVARPAGGAIHLPSAPTTSPVTIRDLRTDTEQVTALYERFSRARQEAGEPEIPYERFATVVKAQVAKIGGGAADVVFRVNVGDGKVSLTAKKE